jgi:hypothetical protein
MTMSAGRINQWLWLHVERHQRQPRWQRLLITTLWVIGATAVVYFWMSAWDCPIC